MFSRWPAHQNKYVDFSFFEHWSHCIPLVVKIKPLEHGIISTMQALYPWHALKTDEVLEKLETSRQGLTTAEAQTRLSAYGKNILPEVKRPTILYFVLQQLKSPLILVLFFAGVVSLFLDSSTDALVIFVAIVINVAIGVFQEYEAEKTFKKLQEELKLKAVVIRDGLQEVIDVSKLVPGDIVILREGDKVPADGRLLSSSSLQVNESVLTGEWLPVEKKIVSLRKAAALPDQNNMVWTGTVVMEGRGTYVVTATGSETEYGKIALLAAMVPSRQTPLSRDIQNLASTIGRVLVILILLIFILGIVRGIPTVTMLLTSIAVAVAAVPEGLPAAISVVLAIGMNRILKQRGLIRQILATETLGRTSVILTDKTGTLTQAKMQVAKILTCREAFDHDGKRFNDRELDSLASHIAVLKIGILTSEAFLDNVEASLRELLPHGDPTDRAFLMAAIQAGIEPKKVFGQEPRLDFLSFSSQRRFAASLHKISPDINRMYFVGAAEDVLRGSVVCYDDGKVSQLADYMAGIEQNLQESVSKGERVLGVGFRDVKLEKFPQDEKKLKNLLQDITFVGIVSLHDPVRPEVAEAILSAKSAGVRPVIITGDHLVTARAVAERVGLDIAEHEMIQGTELAGLNDEELKIRVPQYSLYARILPEQKLRVVRAWQAHEEVVAMVGDGVNDAPALKQADIGVALGSGTEVAKEASQLVLLDDSFSIIVKAVEGGRVILDNIQKVITYLLSTGFTELILVGGSLIAGFPLPVLPVQILWANLVEEGIQSFSLAFEPKEEDVMKRRPRPRKKPLFTKEMLVLIFVVGIATDLYLFLPFLFFLRQGYPMAEIRTLMFLGLSIDAMVSIFALKSLRRSLWKINAFSNRYLLFATFLNILVLVAVFSIPILRELLHLVPISSDLITIAIFLGLADLVTIELGKYYFISKKIID